MINKPLILAVDMYGCPNRCRHCWIGHMPNREMEENADVIRIEKNHIPEVLIPYYINYEKVLTERRCCSFFIGDYKSYLLNCYMEDEIGLLR